MGFDSQDDRKDDLAGPAKRKLKLLIDKLHKEELSTYDKLIEFLQELCQVSILKKKPLDLELLAENDVFVLISPSKSWKESEVEIVKRYVKSNGGILIVMTIEGRRPERLNELLKPFGLSVTKTTVDEKQLDRHNLERPQLFDGINSLALGTVWKYKSLKIEASNEAEVILKYKDAILGAKRSLGKGTAYLFSCLPAFGNKQLKQVDNRRFLSNLITLLATPDKIETLATGRDETNEIFRLATDRSEESLFKLIKILREAAISGDTDKVKKIQTALKKYVKRERFTNAVRTLPKSEQVAILDAVRPKQEESVELLIDELVKLCTEVNMNYKRLPYSEAQKAQKQLEVRIREIGQKLFNQGEKKLMLEIHALVASRCIYGRYLEGVWSGIGDWMG